MESVPGQVPFILNKLPNHLQPLLNLLRKIGLDKSIAFTVLGKSIGVIGSVSIIYFISRYLTGKEQGFYYTFSSLTALQIFFELGLSYVIIHYASYETAWLQPAENYTLTGDEKAKSRLSSLLRFTMKWYGVVALCLLLFLLPGGYLFFKYSQESTENISWWGPWAFLVLAEALHILITPLFSFLEGCGKVKQVAFFRIFQGIFYYGFLALGFLLGLKLYVIGVGIFISFLTGLVWLTRKPNRVLVTDLWRALNPNYVIEWRKEILPFQWKIALSWVSGYLIFQLFNPVLFAFQGSEIAGQMGMSLAAFSGVSVVAMAWINTKIPTFSVLIARKDYSTLDQIFFRTAIQSFFVSSCISLGLAGFIYGLQYLQLPIGNRFLPAQLAFFMALINLLNQIIFAQAIYLRAHKQEPFLINSVVGAILTGSCTYITGRFFEVSAVVLGYFLLTLFIGLPWATYIFVTKRKLWHQPPPAIAEE